MLYLTPDILANVLARQKYITVDQATEVKKAARRLPRHARTIKAYQQRSVAYELIESLGLESRKNGGQRIDQHVIADAIAAEANLDRVRIDPLKLDADLIEQQISRPFARRHRMIPLERRDGVLRVGLANPFDIEGIDSFRRIAGGDIELAVASEPEILKALTEFYGLRQSMKKAERDLSAGIDLGNLEALVRMKSEAEIESSDQHVVNAVEYMLQHSYDSRASDIHIEPKRDSSLIRFRIDGILHDIQAIPKVVHAAVISRIKAMARLDIAEKRKPQDGRLKTVRGDKEIELRVSTLPVAFGEKVVLRIFDPTVLLQDLQGLGFYPEELQIFESFITRPHGIVLVTGPTGSGKTTTLYSALKTVANSDYNVTTIEDPIELVYDTFNQTAVNPRIGITFAAALRHILRQDPDIIMVGEVRDAETAQYAIQAALTGHLVFATLHTNDAATSISRLEDLGIERFMISSTLIGTMAQRLVRRICQNCQVERFLGKEEAETLSLTVPEGKRIKVYEGEGCHECRLTGYQGRSGIFEILSVEEKIKELVNDGADTQLIKREAVRLGMKTLRQAALRKLADGVTTFEEVVRVTAF
ncbi:MAG: GspE/PulE family protein [Thermoanaerobaculia bacterium]|nr:GspE/PulE family protein [Thermoanaerobaculia bacterium]